ncbi:MAG TPA: hypothetical protein VKB12_14535 [Pyrinomonadaceae bacterium]|nr:hypothetical protein [Pyrinomonadaceae bacterium]
MNKKRAIILLCCITLCTAAASPAFGQEAEAVPKEVEAVPKEVEAVPKDKRAALKDKRITITMEAQPLGVVFRYLMENYDIPIGFEESVLDREGPEYGFATNMPSTAKHEMRSGDVKFTTTALPPGFEGGRHAITLYIEDGSVEEVFTRIVEQMDNYKLEINDDVVNIFPVKGRDKRFEKLLETRIKRFTLEGGKTVEDITTNIQALPEIRSFLRDNKLHFTGVRQGMNFVLAAQYGRRIEAGMDFSDLTFRDLLNRITKVKRGGWRLEWKWITGKGEEHIDIDI